MVRVVGLEPTLLSEPDFESGASTNFTTPASSAHSDGKTIRGAIGVIQSLVKAAGLCRVRQMAKSVPAVQPKNILYDKDMQMAAGAALGSAGQRDISGGIYNLFLLLSGERIGGQQASQMRGIAGNHLGRFGDSIGRTVQILEVGRPHCLPYPVTGGDSGVPREPLYSLSLYSTCAYPY